MSEKRNTGEIVWSLRKGVAGDIVNQIRNGKARTTKEIADNIDTTSSSVSNYLKVLREKGFVVRGEKEGRKQKYKTTDKMDRFFERKIEIEERINELEKQINQEKAKLEKLADEA